jgi:hypothetical protein
MRDVLQGVTTRDDWYASNSSDLYLHSYAVDVNNVFSTGVVGSKNYSGYDAPVRDL